MENRGKKIKQVTELIPHPAHLHNKCFKLCPAANRLKKSSGDKSWKNFIFAESVREGQVKKLKMQY